MATRYEIQKIHMLKNALNLDDDLYREILNNYGAESCKEIPPHLTDEFIKYLEQMAIESGKWNLKPKKFDELANRPDMASPKQLRLIDYLWKIICERREKDNNSLRKFLYVKFKVSDLRFISRKTANKVINALKNIDSNYINV
ncbi:MAG: phage protein GemA/Gp16 family protein [bacterium]